MCRTFCGFSFAEIAAMQDASERTIQRKWERTRIFWLEDSCDTMRTKPDAV
jgi:ECF sigma factor